MLASVSWPARIEASDPLGVDQSRPPGPDGSERSFTPTRYTAGEPATASTTRWPPKTRVSSSSLAG